MPTPISRAYISRTGETAFRPEQLLVDISTSPPIRGSEGIRLVILTERIKRRYYEDSLRRMAFTENKTLLVQLNEKTEADVDESILRRYVQAAIIQAVYEVLPDDGSFYGEIPDFQGVYANADTMEDCRIELAEVLEDWLTLRLSWHRPVPVVDGIDLSLNADNPH